MSTIKTYKKHDIFCNTTPMRIIRRLQQTHVLPPHQPDTSEPKCSFGMCVCVIRQEIVRFFTPSPSPLHHSTIVLGSKRIRRFATQKRLRTQRSSVFIISRVVLLRPAFKALQLYRLLTFRTKKATSTQCACLPWRWHLSFYSIFQYALIAPGWVCAVTSSKKKSTLLVLTITALSWTFQTLLNRLVQFCFFS